MSTIEQGNKAIMAAHDKIPHQLRKDSFSFVKLKARTKIPFEMDWPNKHYSYLDIKTWIDQGGNYGVHGGCGKLIIIDADKRQITEIVRSKFPETFTVKTPGQGCHFYYLCDSIETKIVLKKPYPGWLEKKIKNKTDTKEERDLFHFGEIIAKGSQVVGAGSTHPKTGTEYQVVNDVEIATLSRESIFSEFMEYITIDYPQKDKETEIGDISIVEVLNKNGFQTKRVGEQLVGSHPVHGSTNNNNFVVHPEKNVWHCFRCCSGGGAMLLIAVLERIIDCQEAMPGALRGDKFIQVLNEAKDKYGFDINEIKAELPKEFSIPFPDKAKYPGYTEATIEIVKETVERNFPKRWRETEACLSVIATLLLEDITNPSSVNLIGPPSSEKTTVLSFFAGLENITYKTDKFTPKSFVSHSVNVPRKKLVEVDLLPRIRAKTMIVPDLVPLFGHRKEDLLENLSVLTRVFDGDGLTSDSGVHGGRGYEGDYMFTWLGASTPIPNKVWNIMGNLGTRWMFLLMPEEEDAYEKDVDKLTIEKPYKIKCKEVKETVHKFLVKLWVETGGFRTVKWEREVEDRALVHVIVQSADLLAKMRGTTSVWKPDGDARAFKAPLIEIRKRAMTMLYNIARGRAIVHGRRKLIPDDLYLPVQIALSSGPEYRCKVIKQLIQKGQYQSLNLSEIKGILRCTNYVAENVMETLRVLGLVRIDPWNPERGGQESSEITLEHHWHWVFEDNYRKYYVEKEQSKKSDGI